MLLSCCYPSAQMRRGEDVCEVTDLLRVGLHCRGLSDFGAQPTGCPLLLCFLWKAPVALNGDSPAPFFSSAPAGLTLGSISLHRCDLENILCIISDAYMMCARVRKLVRPEDSIQESILLPLWVHGMAHRLLSFGGECFNSLSHLVSSAGAP